jgi:hypothetical protein
MNPISRAIVHGAPLRARNLALQILAILPIASCGLFQGATRLPDMNDDEVAAYGEYAAGTVASVARVAVDSGDLTLDALWKIQSGFEVLGLGIPPDSTSQFFDLKSYGALALQLTLNDLHYQLVLRGGLTPEGRLVPNAQAVCMVISARLKALHQELRQERE